MNIASGAVWKDGCMKNAGEFLWQFDGGSACPVARPRRLDPLPAWHLTRLVVVLQIVIGAKERAGSRMAN